VRTPLTPSTKPRIEGAREDEILDATLEMLLEVGYDRLTMDAVARRARAGKASLYRRWDTKQSLVVDAVVRAKHAPVVGDHDTGSLRGDLRQTFCGAEGVRHGAATGALGAVVTALSTDPAFAAVFRERFIAPKTEVTRAIYARAVERGEISADLDLEIIGPALAGILLHRSFVMGLPLDDDVVERVIDHVILPAVGCAPPVPPPPASSRPDPSSKTDPSAPRRKARTS
jgi:AcrR family transcriptional regulator